MNIFLDCGFYAGMAMKEYKRKRTINKTWTIYAFEPNPELDVERFTADIPLELTLMKKAVWVKDGEIPFQISGRADSARVEEVRSDGTDKTITVECIDFSKFVSELPEANIICSMDIEGSEYPVLEKMLEDGTMSRINRLDIEFHHRILPDKTMEDSIALIKKIKECGVKVKLKVELE